MRFLLVIVCWVVIVGGLSSYISNRDERYRQVEAPVVADLTVEGVFTIEVTPTFSIEKDPFALTTSNESSPSLVVRVNGNPVAIEADQVMRGQTIRYENLEGILTGHNEIYVEASPPLSESMLEHGIRVKLYEESTILVDNTVWSEQGGLVSGSVNFNHQKDMEEQHDH